MKVVRVQGRGGSYIKPPLDEGWDDETKLAWKAAVVAIDTGLKVAVRWHEGGYSFTVGGTRIGQGGFRDTWDRLSGVSTGACNARCADAATVRKAKVREPIDDAERYVNRALEDVAVKIEGTS